MTTVAIYTRLSRDPDGTQTATARQEKDCRALADLRGWDVVAVHTDVDLSAYRRGVSRPGYEQALTAVADGHVDGVLVWKLDRLVRRSAEFERFWSACETHSAFLASATEPIDTTTDLGMVIVRILVSFAQLESATMSLRIRRAKEERARSGLPSTTATRPFGLTQDWANVVPEEAALIVEAADRVLAGDSLRSVALDWGKAGLTAPRGGRWKTATIRHILLNPRVVGDREYKGEVVRVGAHPAILDRDTQSRVAAILTDPARRPATYGRTAVLSGLLRCGRCGTVMRAGKASTGQPRYQCPPAPEGCNGLTCQAGPAETFVATAVVAALTDVGFNLVGNQRNADTVAATTSLGEVEAALGELARDYYLDRTVSRVAFDAAHGELQARQHRLQRLVGSLRRTTAVEHLLAAGPDIPATWEVLPAERQRAVIGDLIDHVTLHPVGRHRRRLWTPEECDITWR